MRCSSDGPGVIFCIPTDARPKPFPFFKRKVPKMIMDAICRLHPHATREQIAAHLAQLDALDVQLHRLSKLVDQQGQRAA